MTLTLERARELFEYYPDAGVFVWGRSLSRGRMGRLAGCTSGQGYLQIAADGRKYEAHRVAWLYVYGEWPSAEIDHINCDKLDNRISNLRIASRNENARNLPLGSTNTSGFKGVCFYPRYKLWVATITCDRKHRTIGYYKTPELAHAAYCAEATKLFGEFARSA